MKILWVLLFLVSCATTPDLKSLRTDTQHILSKFNAYHLKYKGRPAPKIYIGMIPAAKLRTQKTIATCRQTPRPHIVINEVVWKETSYAEKEYILFHELGHCILRRTHDNQSANGKPLSIMHQAFSYHHLDYFHDDKKFYIEELFTLN